jgi:hypothetical protein
MQAGNAVRLGQDHRAELAGADQADPHRPPRGRALLRQMIKAHRSVPLFAATAKLRARKRMVKAAGPRPTRPCCW